MVHDAVLLSVYFSQCVISQSPFSQVRQVWGSARPWNGFWGTLARVAGVPFVSTENQGLALPEQSKRREELGQKGCCSLIGEGCFRWEMG